MLRADRAPPRLARRHRVGFAAMADDADPIFDCDYVDPGKRRECGRAARFGLAGESPSRCATHIRRRYLDAGAADEVYLSYCRMHRECDDCPTKMKRKSPESTPTRAVNMDAFEALLAGTAPPPQPPQPPRKRDTPAMSEFVAAKDAVVEVIDGQFVFKKRPKTE